MGQTPKGEGSHNAWFGDAAESYVAYCFAREGLEVFGAGKWAADLAVCDKTKKGKDKKCLKIEVKSTVRKGGWRSPIWRYDNLKKLSNKADILATVCLNHESNSLKLELVSLGHLVSGQRRKPGGKDMITKEGSVRDWLKRNKNLIS